MAEKTLPLILSAPAPRTVDLIFTSAALARLREHYEAMEVEPEAIDGLNPRLLERVRYILGQPPLAHATIDAMTSLRAILNVEGNFLNNMPYDALFTRGIHVLTPSNVFSEPVAELGLAMALNLARGIVDADLAFRSGTEIYGMEGNRNARLLYGSEVGIIGFGNLGHALHRVLTGFRTHIRAYDPWLPASLLEEAGVEPAPLDDVLSKSDVIFVVASVTTENKGFLGAEEFQKMRKGAIFVLLSRAGVVDFPAMVEAAAGGHISVATDVFPQEPMPKDDPVRSAPNFLRSAHRAGALDAAFKQMGSMVLEDMDLMDRGLPPMRLKRAERETVARMRSRPVTRS